ncbi:zf-HC2 domain-containing protein [Kaistia adipata]|uniref:zf-HC2 domain-containing protein n=1 Tax=Kaistia adipata TaxID=166954 RepID=UPI00048DEE66|nr:zf-HC2 domain-containing protein [Kaistia adipata]
MTTPTIDEPGRIEALLPWYAAGTLSAEERLEVEAALAEDPLLRAQLERIEEERMATIADAEAMPLPSRQMADRLFAEIAATAPVQRPSWSERLLAPLGNWLAALTAPQLGMGAAAAAIALLVLGGVVGGTIGGRGVTGGYQTASGPEAVNPSGAFLLVAFEPDAKAADIETLVGSLNAAIVDGPRAGGLYKLRIGEESLSAEEREMVQQKLAAAKGVVKLVIAAP